MALCRRFPSVDGMCWVLGVFGRPAGGGTGAGVDHRETWGKARLELELELEWLSTYGVSVASLVQAALAGWLGLQLKTAQSIGKPLGIGSRCGAWGVPGTSHGAGMGLRPSAHTGCIDHWPGHLSSASACVIKGESEGHKWHFPVPLTQESIPAVTSRLADA